MVATALRTSRANSWSVETTVRHDAVQAHSPKAPEKAATNPTGLEAKPRAGFFATLLRALSASCC